jgi:hypothetical protein
MTSEAELQQYSGCLYETPTAEGKERDWRVDPTSGSEYPFDLTTNEILKMRFEGLPIKIEHTHEGFSEGDEVGRVKETTTDPTSGYTAVKFALHDTTAGRTVARLIKSGVLDSLSLGHLYEVASGTLTPSEVSVCFNGARPGSCLYKEMDEYDRFRSTVHAKGRTMAALNDPPQGTNDEIAASVGGGAVVSAPMNIADLLTSVTSVSGVNEEDATELFKQVQDMVNSRKASGDEREMQRNLIANLEKQVAGMSQKNKSDSSKIVSIMNALLAEYTGSDNVIAEGADGESDLRQVAMQVPVLASALSAHKQAGVKVDTLASIRATIAADIKKAMLAPPVWEPERQAPQEVDHSASIAINASARGRSPWIAAEPERPAKSGRFGGYTAGQQNALKGISSFGDGASAMMTSDMIPSNYKYGTLEPLRNN